ncbi:hypothetical protein [Kineococcus rubinsiae]|uniref:hypothetical protein n=1 Tax=Kineococcus rubinsiae TaxID=2609562 RepID=UPI0014314000|nr:hypothetical protein [Kineococcus rubinsiae]NIZ90949.1 hypothetical protein [Kineococcus rubinsiae]
MDDLVDARLRRHVEESGYHLVADADTFGLRDAETQFRGRRGIDGYVAEEVQRDSLVRSWTTLERSAVDAPETVRVQRDDRGDYGLTWSEGGRPCRAERLDRSDAVAVAHLPQRSMDDVLAAVERLDAEPVFSRVLWEERPRRTSGRG